MNLYQSDLDKLNALYVSKKSSIVFLTGMAGIGKTTLLQTFAKEKKTHYFCFRISINNLLIAAEESHKSPYSWRDYLISLLKENEKILIIFDSFEQAGQDALEFLEQLNDFYRDYENSNMMIILSGRKIPLNDNIVFYDLKEITLLPLTFRQLKRLYPSKHPEQLVSLYGLTGGIIDLINLFQDGEEATFSDMLTIGNSFYQNKVEAHLLAKLRDLSTYNLFLSLLAQNVSLLNDLKTASNQERAKVSVYLGNLIDIGVVAKDEHRRANYSIIDPLIKLYYRFIYPNLSLQFNRDAGQLYATLIKPYLNNYLEDTFKNIVLEYLQFQSTLDLLPFKIDAISKYEQSGQTIDYVINGKDGIIFANCYYDNEYIGVDAYYILNARALNISRDESKNYYYLFSKVGFDEALKELAKEKRRIRLVDLATIHNL